MSAIAAHLPVQPAATTALVVVPVALHLPTAMVMPKAGQYLSPSPLTYFSDICQRSSQERAWPSPR